MATKKFPSFRKFGQIRHVLLEAIFLQSLKHNQSSCSQWDKTRRYCLETVATPKRVTARALRTTRYVYMHDNRPGDKQARERAESPRNLQSEAVTMHYSALDNSYSILQTLLRKRVLSNLYNIFLEVFFGKIP